MIVWQKLMLAILVPCWLNSCVVQHTRGIIRHGYDSHHKDEQEGALVEPAPSRRRGMSVAPRPCQRNLLYPALSVSWQADTAHPMGRPANLQYTASKQVACLHSFPAKSLLLAVLHLKELWVWVDSTLWYLCCDSKATQWCQAV